jgi:hypothetical protein
MTPNQLDLLTRNLPPPSAQVRAFAVIYILGKDVMVPDGRKVTAAGEATTTSGRNCIYKCAAGASQKKGHVSTSRPSMTVEMPPEYARNGKTIILWMISMVQGEGAKT